MFTDEVVQDRFAINASHRTLGAIGFIFERVVFGALEKYTVQRWGMVKVTKG
jgi:NitT/TauT family transport system permease protein